MTEFTAVALAGNPMITTDPIELSAFVVWIAVVLFAGRAWRKSARIKASVLRDRRLDILEAADRRVREQRAFTLGALIPTIGIGVTLFTMVGQQQSNIRNLTLLLLGFWFFCRSAIKYYDRRWRIPWFGSIERRGNRAGGGG